ncbi:MAG TPA: hypothetical protein VFS32_11775 [Candidatus Limnocylindrales bacterium]|nr:hypothetical protein [Candidatus Limnocylindrales bacterium]
MCDPRGHRRLARLARLLTGIHVRRAGTRAGSFDDRVLELVEDEAATELRREIERLEAIAAPPLTAGDLASHGPDATN